MALSCLYEMESRYNSLTVTEKRIADFIIQNSDEVLMMPVDELARRTGAAKSAVIRLSKSLGFSGYTALKMSLSRDVARNVEADYSNSIEINDCAESIVNKVFSANIQTLTDTAKYLDVKALEKIANILADANNIYVFGIGSSGVMSMDFQHRLFQVGYPSVAVTDVTTMKDSTMNMKPGDVAFAFCDSGRTIVTVDTLKLAKKRGATTVCLTGYQESPITKVSDYCLFTMAKAFKYPIESVTSRVARTAVIDALIVTLSTIRYSTSLEKMLQTRQLINDTRIPIAGTASLKYEK